MSNRLAQETSPYLLQHKDNPVDWHPWDDEALSAARANDKPILLSIGYSACHWCHVMEKESFEDPDTATFMNEHFVPIKVDREERPDLDAIYMDAVQAMTGHGGWPMTVFLTPDGVPFYGGTYFPPTDRHGIPSFRKVLAAIVDTWVHRRAEVEAQGAKLVDHIAALAQTEATSAPVTSEALARAGDVIRAEFDPQHGGFGTAPKFPQPMTLDLALRLTQGGIAGLDDVVTHTLDRMASGGMFDQLAGGFARYSVDRAWIVPHFEKMLYDNAQLLRTYTRSWQVTRSERHRRVATATVEWMLSEMRTPEGGFASSLDADSEGVEGRFYVWDLDEVRDVTGDDFDAAVAAFGFTAEGNFEGRNIPVYTGAEVDPAAVERARAALLAARSERVRPATDTKVLTAWNGLAAAALAEAGTVLDRAWISAAEEAMDFVFESMHVEGRLQRSYNLGVTKYDAFAEDYAATLEACLALYEAIADPQWLSRAQDIADQAIELFLDEQRGGFFTTGNDSERLVTRPKDLIDNAVPAANSVFAMELQRLALLTGDNRYDDVATKTLALVAPLATRSPLAFGHALGALDLHLSKQQEIVIVGKPDARDTLALLDEVRDRYLPNSVLVVHDQPDTTVSPLLESRIRVDGRATAYVCHNRVCKQPVTSPADLAAQLDR